MRGCGVFQMGTDSFAERELLSAALMACLPAGVPQSGSSRRRDRYVEFSSTAICDVVDYQSPLP
jgi:hypothetical protein